MVTRSGRTSANPNDTATYDLSSPRRYSISPTVRVDSSGVWPGRTPNDPSAPGTTTSSTSPWAIERSGVTISSVR